MIKELCEWLDAEPDGVITEISEVDEMYRPDRLDFYFEMGRSALRCIRLAMLVAGKRDVRSLLDFPCGHGRVLRMLKAEFPQARFSAGDINEDGVRFCERIFGAKPIYSSLDAAEVEIDDQFDLVWCGSLLTHLGLDRWNAFFSLLVDSVEEDGLFVFTAFGDWAASRMRNGVYNYRMNDDQIEWLLNDYERDGFAYEDYPGQVDSGMSLTSPAWMFEKLATRPELRLVGHFPRAWGGHQDVWVCVKPPGSS